MKRATVRWSAGISLGPAHPLLAISTHRRICSVTPAAAAAAVCLTRRLDLAFTLHGSVAESRPISLPVASALATSRRFQTSFSKKGVRRTTSTSKKASGGSGPSNVGGKDSVDTGSGGSGADSDGTSKNATGQVSSAKSVSSPVPGSHRSSRVSVPAHGKRASKTSPAATAKDYVVPLSPASPSAAGPSAMGGSVGPAAPSTTPRKRTATMTKGKGASAMKRGGSAQSSVPAVAVPTAAAAAVGSASSPAAVSTPRDGRTTQSATSAASRSGDDGVPPERTHSSPTVAPSSRLAEKDFPSLTSPPARPANPDGKRRSNSSSSSSKRVAASGIGAKQVKSAGKPSWFSRSNTAQKSLPRRQRHQLTKVSTSTEELAHGDSPAPAKVPPPPSGAARRSSSAPVGTEEEMPTERAGIMKLFMIADALASILNASGRDRESFHQYIRAVDNVVQEHEGAATHKAAGGDEDCDDCEPDDAPREGDNDDLAVVADARAPEESRAAIMPSSSVAVASSGARMAPSAAAHGHRGADSGCGELHPAAEEMPDENSDSVADVSAVIRPSETYRLLVEVNTAHSLSIHVRDLEQLAPPIELLCAPVATENDARSATLEGGTHSAWRGDDKRGRAKKATTGKEVVKPKDISRCSTAPATPLSDVERVRRLCQWQREALDATIASQKLWAVPSRYHTITRVRFNSPGQEDVTVVQGREAEKTLTELMTVLEENKLVSSDTMLFDYGHAKAEEQPASPSMAALADLQASLASLPRSVGIHRGRTRLQPTIDDFVDTPPHTEVIEDPETKKENERRAWLGKPLLVKPLLTVFASTIPRRERVLGANVSESSVMNYVVQQRGVADTSDTEDEMGETADKHASDAHSPNSDGPDHTTAVLDARLTASLSPLYFQSPGCVGEESSDSNHVEGMPRSPPPSGMPGDPNENAYWSEMQLRRDSRGDAAVARGESKLSFPPMPMYSTWITVLEEHEEMDSMELLAMADSSLPSTLGRDARAARGAVANRAPRVYCLIQDGGKAA